MEAYIGHLANGIRIFEIIVTFVLLLHSLKIYQTNKEYIFCTFFIKIYTEYNEQHLNYNMYWGNYTWFVYLYFKDKQILKIVKKN